MPIPDRVRASVQLIHYMLNSRQCGPMHPACFKTLWACTTVHLVTVWRVPTAAVLWTWAFRWVDSQNISGVDVLA